MKDSYKNQFKVVGEGERLILLVGDNSYLLEDAHLVSFEAQREVATAIGPHGFQHIPIVQEYRLEMAVGSVKLVDGASKYTIMDLLDEVNRKLDERE